MDLGALIWRYITCFYNELDICVCVCADAWIEKVRQTQHLEENELKMLCEYVRSHSHIHTA